MTNPMLTPKVNRWINHLNHTDIHFITLIQNACIFASIHEQTNSLFSLSTLTQGLAMADVLWLLKTDDDAIVAAIIYPAVSCQPALIAKVEEQFNKTICKIITGALQMEVIHAAHEQKNRVTAQQNQVDNLRKMMLAMVDDVRTILLKLAERLILLQHANHSAAAIQQKISQETLDYYAPLANRLGIGQLKWQLEDWAFRYINPSEYQKISNAFHMRREDRIKLLHRMIAELKTVMASGGLKNIKISGRIKHIYSIYKKILRKKVGFDSIYDTNAIRILVNSIPDCYTALSLVHAKWTPIKPEFDDYIAKPKSNGYQSIHTAIIGDNHMPIEIQIRTVNMHEKAELGIAAHWKYKEGGSAHATDEQKIVLLRELLDWQKNTLPEEKTQLYAKAFHDRIYVFSPTGDVFDLPKGATPLDFAYLIHSEIGHRCRGAKINNVLVPLTAILQTGDRVDIITTKKAQPSQDWLRKELGYLTTLHAKQKVRLWFRKQQQEKPAEPVVTSAMPSKIKTAPPSPLTTDFSAFSVLGEKQLLTQLAKCCHPIPGDEIMGYITKGRGISVHQKKCRNIVDAMQHRSEKLIDITWENRIEKKYRVGLEIVCEDRPGLLRDIGGFIAQLNLSIFAMTSRVDAQNAVATIALHINVNNIALLNSIMKKLRQIKGVITVNRK